MANRASLTIMFGLHTILCTGIGRFFFGITTLPLGTLLIFFHFLLQKADINGDGYISADEYCRILREHGIDCTREEILQIMQIAGMFMLSGSCLECALPAS